MVLPHVSTVHYKFRLAAKWFAGLWGFAIFASLGLSLRTIYVHREHPQTAVHYQNAQDEDVWNALPMFFFYRNAAEGDLNGPDWKPEEPPGSYIYGNGFKTETLKPVFSRAGDSWMMNASMMRPQFETPVLGGPMFKFQLPVNAGTAFDVYLFDADAKISGQELDNFNADNVSQFPESQAQWQTLLTVAANEMDCAWLFTLTKRFVPKVGVFWGWPWEGKHVVPKYLLDGPICTHFPSNQSPMLIVHITQETVLCVQPISLIQQACSAFKDVGASVALLSTIFYLVFTRRFPLTVQEEESIELTLRGFESTKRPTVEKWLRKHPDALQEALREGLLSA